MIDKRRIYSKYSKYKKRHGSLSAYFKILVYIFNDIGNYALRYILKPTKDKIDLIENQKILFIEPYKQGYGDLIFQTPLIEIFSKQHLTFLIREKHSCIVENNPKLNCSYHWNLKNIIKSYL